MEIMPGGYNDNPFLNLRIIILIYFRRQLLLKYSYSFQLAFQRLTTSIQGTKKSLSIHHRKFPEMV